MPEPRSASGSRKWDGGAVLSSLAVFVLLAAGVGCRLLQDAADLPGNAVRVVLPGGKKQQTVDLVELQQILMRFSDQFVAGAVLSIDKLQVEATPLPPAEVLNWKIRFCDNVWGIATGPNALANLLDMVVVVTMTRLTVENHWRPKVYGGSAQPLLDLCRTAEEDIWQIAGRVLNNSQLGELRSAVLAYHARQPDPDAALSIRAFAFLTMKDRKAPDRGSGGTSVFGLLMLDPLAELSPATRELAQTRLFGERAVFLAQRMPRLLRWQTELWSLNTAELPEVQQLVTNATQLSEAAQRLSRVAEELPARLSEERKKIVEAVDGQQPGLTALAAETRQALAEGSRMASNVNLALKTFDGVVQRFDSQPRDKDREPFHVRDYAEAAAEIGAAARQLAELLESFDATLGSSNLARLTTEAEAAALRLETSGQAVVDRAFGRAAALIALSCVLVLTSALAYRWLAIRWTRRPGSSSGQS